MAGIVFLVLAVISIREFLTGESFFVYRDVLGFDPASSLYNAITSFSLDASRRILYLGPFLTIITALKISPLVAQKTTFLLIHFMIGYLAYLSSYKFLSSRIVGRGSTAIFVVSVVFGFFYLYNPRVAQGLSLSGWGYAFSYALIPIIFYYYDKSLRNAKLSDIFVTSILISLAIAGTAQFLVDLPVLVLIPWLLFALIRRIRKHEPLFQMIRTSLIIFALWFAISFYWIYVSALTITRGLALEPGYVLTNQMLDVFSSTASLSNVIRLTSSWWPWIDVKPIFNESVWTYLTFIIPIAIISSVLLLKSAKLKYELLSLALISVFIIFLAKGTQPPLSDFYPRLYDIPLVGWMFRLPSSTAVFLPFYFGMMIIIGLYKLLSTNTNQIARYLKFILPSALIVSVSLVGWPMFTGNFGGIYKNNNASVSANKLENASNISISHNAIAVFGNNDTVSSFYSEWGSNGSAIIPVDYNRNVFQSGVASPNLLRLDNTDPSHALFYQLADKNTIIVAPFVATRDHDPSKVWSVAGTSDPLHGPFHTYLKKFGVTNGDTDYGKGLVLTWAKNTLEIPVQINTPDTYHMLIRFLGSEAGGSMTVSMDSRAFDISTKDSSNEFVWKDFGSLDLTSGKHSITLENKDGLNAVNIFLLVPAKSLSRIINDVNAVLEHSTIIYNLNDKDFDKEGKIVGEGFIDQDSGHFDKLMAGQIVAPHDATSLALQFQILQNANSTSSYTIKDLRLMPSYEKFLLAQDFEEPSEIKSWSASGKFISIVPEDKNPISGAHSMRIDIKNGTSSGWDVISTKRIPVTDNTNIRYQFIASGQNTTSPHAKVIYYDGNNKIIGSDVIFRSPKNNYLQSIDKTLKTPFNTESISLQFWMQPNKTNSSRFMADSLRIERIYPSTYFNNDFESFRNINSDNQAIVVGPNSITVNTYQNNAGGWSSIQTFPIAINRNIHLNYNIGINGENVKHLYVRVLYYNDTNDQVLEKNDAENGIRIDSGSSVFSNVDILKPGSYTVAMKADTCQQCEPIRLTIGGKPNEVSLKNEIEQVEWRNITTMLAEGKTDLAIYSDGTNNIDTVLIYSNNRGETIDSIMGTNQSNIEYQYERISPTKYVVKTNELGPFMLSFDKEFNSLWSASADGREYEALRLFPNTIGFYIDKEGPSEVTIEYKPQQWLIHGSLVTISTIVMLTGFLIWQNRKYIMTQIKTNLTKSQRSENLANGNNTEGKEITHEYGKTDYNPKQPEQVKILSHKTNQGKNLLHYSLDLINPGRPEFVILLSLALFVVSPFLLIGKYESIDNLVIAAYLLLVIGVLWKYISTLVSSSRSME